MFTVVVSYVSCSVSKRAVLHGKSGTTVCTESYVAPNVGLDTDGCLLLYTLGRKHFVDRAQVISCCSYCFLFG